jgi:glycosyltransferase involved in cell wall biosynthesis
VETTSFEKENRLQSVPDEISKEEVTIVLPVLNEEKAVGPVIRELVSEGYHNLMLVDGYSTDATIENAKHLGVQIVQQHGRGKKARRNNWCEKEHR